MKVYISTDPFGSISTEPINQLKYNGFEYRCNNFGRKITSEELANDIKDADILIAGTESITQDVLNKAPNLKLISRVGIGLDGIDFDLCRKRGVRVAYTPDAPTIAVAELSVGLILDCCRKVTETNNNLKTQGVWRRHMGTLLNNRTVGLLGLGRIGKTLVHMLAGFNVNFIAHDHNADIAFSKLYNITLAPKVDVLKYSDIVSMHLPLTESTRDYITYDDLSLMQRHAILINTARGGIVNEEALYQALQSQKVAAAAVDVFYDEPYSGPLKELDNCILTCHMGASTTSSRVDMEIQAVQEAIRFSKAGKLKNEVFENV
ncbi:phosphoglycerate dehydrogenase [Gilvimarinus sp. 1_MG-2023]|uniref:phosphoglycerate dehydrogenase n=1 Tax=Gilvimarinus sp. 1_MG-2023 TaxID=3062638 RepID=UPI0026E3AF0B|nr:phosphoglycerate dehydrogenase [Gilvimarinus sp. 1_MG-2023]MDO6746297.1 phosphoglycerate dehydrogenase [Gilvimarinus sp. 1_MG-2023]